MKKKSILITVALVVVVAAVLTVTTILIISLVNKNNTDAEPETDEKRELIVDSFNVEDYKDDIEAFPSDEVLGEISDAKDAVTKAEKMFIKVFGEEAEKEKPYRIFYDQKNELWLIMGTLPENMMGGCAHIIFRNDNGKVLAIWSEC